MKLQKNYPNRGTKYFDAIKNSFGQEIFLKDGNLNRKALANKIYNDKISQETLNKLTFKYVVDEILFRIKNISDPKIKLAVLDAPLLFESRLDKHCDFVLSVIADEEEKINRICSRDNISRETAQSRLKIQHNNSYYIEKSDFVINNSENSNLISQIRESLKKMALKIHDFEYRE